MSSNMLSKKKNNTSASEEAKKGHKTLKKLAISATKIIAINDLEIKMLSKTSKLKIYLG